MTLGRPYRSFVEELDTINFDQMGSNFASAYSAAQRNKLQQEMYQDKLNEQARQQQQVQMAKNQMAYNQAQLASMKKLREVQKQVGVQGQARLAQEQKALGPNIDPDMAEYLQIEEQQKQQQFLEQTRAAEMQKLMQARQEMGLPAEEMTLPSYDQFDDAEEHLRQQIMNQMVPGRDGKMTSIAEGMQGNYNQVELRAASLTAGEMSKRTGRNMSSLRLPENAMEVAPELFARFQNEIEQGRHRKPSKTEFNANIALPPGNIEATAPARDRAQKTVAGSLMDLGAFGSIEGSLEAEDFTYSAYAQDYATSLIEKVSPNWPSEKSKEDLKRRTYAFAMIRERMFAYRKLITGVAGGEKEMKKIENNYMNPNQSWSQFTAHLQRLKDDTARAARIHTKIMAEGFTGSQEELEKRMQEEFQAGVTYNAKTKLEDGRTLAQARREQLVKDNVDPTTQVNILHFEGYITPEQRDAALEELRRRK